MAEITIRRTGELLRVLFEVLLEHPEGIRAKDAIAEVAKRVNLTPYEQGEYPSGGRRYDRIIRFATIDCVRAGWLVKRDGVWFLTERGKQAYESFSDPEKFYREARRLYNQWRSQLRDREEAEEEKTAQALLEEEEEKASSEIERYLSGMNPYDFQRLVAGLLKAMGYHVSWVAPPGKDGGVDIIAWVDPLGTRPPRVKVQVKREQSPASVHAVRAFLATLMEGEVGGFREHRRVYAGCGTACTLRS